jgi:hypothetical protein
MRGGNESLTATVLVHHTGCARGGLWRRPGKGAMARISEPPELPERRGVEPTRCLRLYINRRIILKILKNKIKHPTIELNGML